VIDPCIPAAWEGYTVKREFRGASYFIRVKNPDHVEHGVKQVTVDGKVITGNKAPLFGDDGEHTVDVVMG